MSLVGQILGHGANITDIRDLDTILQFFTVRRQQIAAMTGFPTQWTTGVIAQMPLPSHITSPQHHPVETETDVSVLEEQVAVVEHVHEVQQPEETHIDLAPKTSYRWGDSPDPQENSGDENVQPKEEVEERKVEVKKVEDMRKIMTEEEKLRGVTELHDFCGKDGHGCCYTLNGSIDRVKYNNDLIEREKLYVYGLPKNLDWKYLAGQLYEVLPADCKPTRKFGIFIRDGNGYGYLAFGTHETATKAFKFLSGPQTASALQNIKVNFSRKQK